MLRQQSLSNVVSELEKAVTPNKTVFVFPRDLIASNDIVEDVVSSLTDDVTEGVGLDSLQTVSIPPA